MVCACFVGQWFTSWDTEAAHGLLAREEHCRQTRLPNQGHMSGFSVNPGWDEFAVAIGKMAATRKEYSMSGKQLVQSVDGLVKLQCVPCCEGCISMPWWFACRHWPVIVSSVDQLPQSVAAGGSLHCNGDSAFPLKLSEASSNGRPEFALPVMALGTQVGCSPASCLSALPFGCAFQLHFALFTQAKGASCHLHLGNMLL